MLVIAVVFVAGFPVVFRVMLRMVLMVGVVCRLVVAVVATGVIGGTVVGNAGVPTTVVWVAAIVTGRGIARGVGRAVVGRAVVEVRVAGVEQAEHANGGEGIEQWFFNGNHSVGDGSSSMGRQVVRIYSIGPRFFL